MNSPTPRGPARKRTRGTAKSPFLLFLFSPENAFLTGGPRAAQAHLPSTHPDLPTPHGRGSQPCVRAWGTGAGDVSAELVINARGAGLGLADKRGHRARG